MLATFCHAAKVTRYSGTRIFWDSRTPVTVFQGGGYARIIELQDGRLMACCESGGIKVCYSSNKGKTWGTPQLIVSNRNNTPNCVPDLIQLQDGTIIVAYNPRPSQPYTQDRRFGIRLKRSRDNGKTWSEEVFVFDADCTFENGCWEPSLLELPSGELQLYFADESPYTTNGDQQISVTRSWDGGMTWSKPDCVSYRQGFRDGMPVPVLLQDGKTIAVAIEDNGMGYGDFVPAVVKNTTTANWRTYVSATSSNRTKAVNYTYCPVATGGAPYMRVLPGGETVLSHQSCYNHGSTQNMYVYVGTKTANSFKAMSTPFRVPESQAALWNSLAVVDTGVVVAVAGFGGNINMVKGYPKKQMEVPFGSPAVDGKFTRGEGYFTTDGHQIMMGSETGTWTYGDFAFDQDSLYFFCQIYDTKKVLEGEYADGIALFLDGNGASYDAPQPSCRRYDIMASGKISAQKGTGSKWTDAQSGIRAVVKKTSATYIIEAAIPWTELDKTEPVLGTVMTFNLEVTNGDGTSKTTERIADAKADCPYTWMFLHLEEDAYTTKIPSPKNTQFTLSDEVSSKYDMTGRKMPNGHKGLYITQGKKFYEQ